MIERPPGILKAAAVGFVVLVAVAGCSNSATPRDASPKSSSGEASPSAADSSIEDSVDLKCADSIGTDSQPPERLTVIDGVVALPVADSFGPVQANPNPQDHDPATRLYAKEPLWIRANHSFDLIVPDDQRDDLAIRRGNSPKPFTWQLHVSCEDSDANWMSFAGGYFTANQKCLSLIVRADGHETRLPVGVGTSCAKN